MLAAAGKTHSTVQSPYRSFFVTLKSTIAVETAPGELIDKITILEIKVERIQDADKVRNVQIELQTLAAARDQAIEATPELGKLTDQLKVANLQLWDIEDDIRDCEREKDFGDKFIQLARSVYRSNDKRAALKREINELLGSHLVEEKSYSDYE